MDRYFKIIDTSKVKGVTNACINGVNANYEEWAKHNFLPQKGIVGFLMGEGYVREGTIYILECAPGIIVPVLPSGVVETTAQDFNSNWYQNLIKGHATKEDIENAKLDEMTNSLMSLIK